MNNYPVRYFLKKSINHDIRIPIQHLVFHEKYQRFLYFFVVDFFFIWGESYYGLIGTALGKSKLGGGNSNVFYFHPDPWGNDPICEHIFPMG